VVLLYRTRQNFDNLHEIRLWLKKYWQICHFVFFLFSDLIVRQEYFDETKWFHLICQNFLPPKFGLHDNVQYIRNFKLLFFMDIEKCVSSKKSSVASKNVTIFRYLVDF